MSAVRPAPLRKAPRWREQSSPGRSSQSRKGGQGPFSSSIFSLPEQLSLKLSERLLLQVISCGSAGRVGAKEALRCFWHFQPSSWKVHSAKEKEGGGGAGRWPATDSDRGRWTPEARKKDRVLRALRGKRGLLGFRVASTLGREASPLSRVLGVREAPRAALRRLRLNPRPRPPQGLCSLREFQPRGLPWNPQGGGGPAPTVPSSVGQKPGRLSWEAGTRGRLLLNCQSPLPAPPGRGSGVQTELGDGGVSAPRLPAELCSSLAVLRSPPPVTGTNGQNPKQNKTHLVIKRD